MKGFEGPTWSALPCHDDCCMCSTTRPGAPSGIGWVPEPQSRTRLHWIVVPSRILFKLCFLARIRRYSEQGFTSSISLDISLPWAQSRGVSNFTFGRCPCFTYLDCDNSSLGFAVFLQQLETVSRLISVIPGSAFLVLGRNFKPIFKSVDWFLFCFKHFSAVIFVWSASSFWDIFWKYYIDDNWNIPIHYKQTIRIYCTTSIYSIFYQKQYICWWHRRITNNITNIFFWFDINYFISNLIESDLRYFSKFWNFRIWGMNKKNNHFNYTQPMYIYWPFNLTCLMSLTNVGAFIIWIISNLCTMAFLKWS